MASQLRKEGCVVVQSSTNQFLKTLTGVREGGKALSLEIRNSCNKFKHIEKISIVGNSLGGLYARYAIKELFNGNGTICGLEPNCFLTIATPHLGIRDFTYIRIPQNMKKALALTMMNTGKDLMLNDAPGRVVENSLLYGMATDSSFLLPLRAFKRRRLYANVDKDFAVPLATAAFLFPEVTEAARKRFANEYGIVAEWTKSDTEALHESHEHVARTPTGSAIASMIRGLDSCDWEKVLVHFDTLLPTAHNKISALQRGPQWMSTMLGFSEGEYVMDHMVRCILSDDAKR